MSTSPWKYPPSSFPADGATVWVEMANPYFRPFQAVWDLATLTFTDTINSAPAPWWTVARWKPI